MAVRIAERSTWWTQTGGSNPDPYGDWRYYWIISYEQTDNDKSLNRSKIIVDYYIQTHCTNYTANSVYPGVPEGTSTVYIDSSTLGSISTEFGKALEKGDSWKLTYLGQKSKYVTHNSDGTKSFTWQGNGFGKGTSVSTYSLPTIAQGGTTPEEPGDDVTFTPAYITSGFYTHNNSATQSRVRAIIDSIVINDNNTMTLKVHIEAGNGNTEEYALSAYGLYIDGAEKVYIHPSSEYTFLNQTWYNNIGQDWSWYRLNTYTITIPVATSFKLKVKGMFYYGWSYDRWNSNTGCVSKEETIYVTIPVKPEYNALIKTADGWKKGFTYIKIGEDWKECEIYYKVGSTWKRGSTE